MINLVCSIWKIISQTVVVIFIITAVAGAEETVSPLQLQGEFDGRFYYDIKENSPFEDDEQGLARLDWWVKWKNKQVNIYSKLRLEGNWFLGQKSRKQTNFFLRESYISWDFDNSRLWIGKQLFTWGKLDDIVIVDKINPQDLRWFVLDEKQERKLPVWALRYQYFADNYDLEFVYLPIFRSSKLNFFGSDWGVFLRLKEMIAAGNYSAAAKNTVAKINIAKNKNMQKDKFSNGQLGLRWRGRLDDIDFSLSYLWIYDNIPVLREKTPNGKLTKKFLYLPNNVNLNNLLAVSPSDEDLQLIEDYPRLHVLGAELETVINVWTVRVESAFVYNSAFISNDFSYVKRNRMLFGIGMERFWGEDFYFNFQAVNDFVFSYPGLFGQKENTTLLTLTLRKEFMRGRLKFDFDLAYNLSFKDRMVNPQIIYRLDNGLNFILGSYIFAGSPTSIFGRYNTKDLVYLQTKYSF